MARGLLVVLTPRNAAAGSRGTLLLVAVRRRRVAGLDSVCGGHGICTRCQVRVSEGEFAKHGIVSASGCLADLTEREHRQRRTGRCRLSCLAPPSGLRGSSRRLAARLGYAPRRRFAPRVLAVRDEGVMGEGGEVLSLAFGPRNEAEDMLGQTMHGRGRISSGVSFLITAGE